MGGEAVDSYISRGYFRVSECRSNSAPQLIIPKSYPLHHPHISMLSTPDISKRSPIEVLITSMFDYLSIIPAHSMFYNIWILFFSMCLLHFICISECLAPFFTSIKCCNNWINLMGTKFTVSHIGIFSGISKYYRTSKAEL